jgi:hypothetical protein
MAAKFLGTALSAVGLYSALKGGSTTGATGRYGNFLSEFRNKSFARTNLFEVSIQPPKIMNGSKMFESLHLYAESANIPGLMFATSETKRYGTGPVEKKPYAPIFNDISVSFLVDGQGELYKFFYTWMNRIVSSDQFVNGNTVSANGLAPFEVEFKDDYKCQMMISTFDEAGNGVLSSQIVDAIPISISDQIMKLQVTFTYFQHILNTDQSEPVSGYKKPLSGFQQIVKAGTALQTISSLKKPQSVGDVINVINNAKVIAGGYFG